MHPQKLMYHDDSFEPLERRALFAVAVDPAGWTVVTPASDTRVVYVSSSSGNDANDGLSAARPVQTLARGQALVRDGSADWLLLKRGDTFGSFGEWKKRGRSEQEPLLISAYGAGPRPQINSGTSAGFITYANGSRRIDNLVISSIGFTAHTYDHYNGNGATAGIRLTCPGDNILIEDVRVSGYKDNVVIDAFGADLTDVTVRRSVIVDAHAGAGVGNGHSQGVYVGPNADRITLEQNLLDHNGWRPGVASDRTYYSHNVYTQTGSRNVTVRGNVITRASFYGVKFNGAGTIEGNLFARNSESVYLESVATVTGNVITEAVDMPSAGWGVGINTQKSPQATIRGNLITKVASSGASGVAGIQLFNNGTPFRGTVEDNVVYDWRNGLLNMTPGAGAGSVVIRRNEFQVVRSDTAAGDHRSGASVSTFAYSDNVYSAGTRTSSANRVHGSFQSLSQWSSKTGEIGARYQQIAYPDATRDLPRYASTVGAGGSVESFLSAARGMDRTTWNPQLTATAAAAWMWAGFGREVGPPSPQPPQPPPPAPVVVAAWTEFDAAQPTVQLRFDTELNPATLSTADLSVTNLSTQQPVAPVAVAFDASTRTAAFALPATLPDGDYTATLPVGAVASAGGAVNSAAHEVGFHVLAGDANRDARVNLADFSTLAGNFNRSGASYSQGDFDFNGRVDLGDFATLAQRFNLSLSEVVTGARAPLATVQGLLALLPTGGELCHVAQRSPGRGVSVDSVVSPFGKDTCAIVVASPGGEASGREPGEGR